MGETHDGRFPSQQNQNQSSPDEPMSRHTDGMTARERRYMRERRGHSHAHPQRDSGSGNLRFAPLRSLLSETLTLDVEHHWRILFPDDEAVDVIDVEEEEVVSVDPEEADDMYAAQDLDLDVHGDAW